MIFPASKYQRWYMQLMERAACRHAPDPCEWHHVVPKALGGHTGQRVALTFREHFLAHWLLTKMVTGDAKRKMLYALGCMKRGGKWHDRTLTGWQYEISRSAWRSACGGRTVSAATKERMRIAAHNRGEDYNARMSIAKMGYKLSDATKAKLSAFMRNIDPDMRERMDSPRRGKSWGKHTEETRRKMSEAAYAREARKVAA